MRIKLWIVIINYLVLFIIKNMENQEKIIPIKKKENKFKTIIIKRKKIIFILLIILIGLSIYFFVTKKSNETSVTYTLSKVATSSIFSYISGTGQVAAESQVDLKPKVSGTIVEMNITVDQEVKEGDVLAILDNPELERKVTEAKNSLAIAQNNLDLKLAGASDEEILQAKNSLNNAKVAYEKAVSNLETVKTDNENNLNKAQQTLDSAQRSYDIASSSASYSTDSNNQEVISAYNSAKSILDSTYLSLRSIIVSADGILGMDYYNNSDTSDYDNLLGAKDSSSLSQAKSDFYVAKEKIENFQKNYDKAISDSLSYNEIENLLEESLSVSEASKTMMNSIYKVLLNTVTSSNFSQTKLDNLKSSASSGESSMLSSVSSIKSSILSISKLKTSLGTSDLSTVNNVTNAKNTLDNAKTNIETIKTQNANNLKSAENEITSKKMALDLAQVQYDNKIAPAKEIDLLSYRVQVSQAQATYSESLEDLENLTITAPIDGKVAQINQEVGEEADIDIVMLSLITNESLAEITVNEVDIASVEVGKNASMTFNAIDDLTLTGKVVEVDNIGATNQGVVSYGVKVSIENPDERIKPQMSVSVDIIIDEAIDVLVVPSSALKQDTSGNYYLETFNDKKDLEIVTNNIPDKIYVEVGLVGDSDTEIISGLNVGDLIITKSIATTIEDDEKDDSEEETSSILGNMGGGMSGGMPSGGPSGGMMP